MKLSKTIQEAFDNWINKTEWYTGHRTDEELFFRFVYTVVQYSRKQIPAEDEIENFILQKWRGRIGDAVLEEKAAYYSRLYVTLSHFAKFRKKVYG